MDVITNRKKNNFSDNEIKSYQLAHKKKEEITLDSSIDEVPLTSKFNFVVNEINSIFILPRLSWRSKWIYKSLPSFT